MRDEGVAGVIFSPTYQAAANFSASNFDFPTVVVDRFILNGEVDAVLLDNLDAGYRLTMHLIDNGYRRIAALCGEKSITGSDRRLGYEKALQARGLTPLAELVKYIPPQIEAGYTIVLKTLDAARPPDAIFTTNSLLAAGALQAIQERHLTIPDDIALISFDETTWASAGLQPPDYAVPTDL